MGLLDKLKRWKDKLLDRDHETGNIVIDTIKEFDRLLEPDPRTVDITIDQMKVNHFFTTVDVDFKPLHKTVAFEIWTSAIGDNSKPVDIAIGAVKEIGFDEADIVYVTIDGNYYGLQDMELINPKFIIDIDKHWDKVVAEYRVSGTTHTGSVIEVSMEAEVNTISLILQTVLRRNRRQRR